MVAAVQPFVSGSVAKTVNLPAGARVAQVAEVFLRAWRLGLKAVAVYRERSKRLEVLRAPAGAGQAASEVH